MYYSQGFLVSSLFCSKLYSSINLFSKIWHVLTEKHCLFEKQTGKLVFCKTELVSRSFNLDQFSAVGSRACKRVLVLLLAQTKDQHRRAKRPRGAEGLLSTAILACHSETGALVFIHKIVLLLLQKTFFPKLGHNSRSPSLLLPARINATPQKLSLTILDPRVGLSYQNFFLLGRGKEVSFTFQQLRETTGFPVSGEGRPPEGTRRHPCVTHPPSRSPHQRLRGGPGRAGLGRVEEQPHAFLRDRCNVAQNRQRSPTGHRGCCSKAAPARVVLPHATGSTAAPRDPPNPLTQTKSSHTNHPRPSLPPSLRPAPTSFCGAFSSAGSWNRSGRRSCATPATTAAPPPPPPVRST